MYEPTRHYGRDIVCLQSSGYGKTRGIFELMKRVSKNLSYRYVLVDFWCSSPYRNVIYVCIRENELGRCGWPPGDTPVWDFLSCQKEVKTYKVWHEIGLNEGWYWIGFTQGEELAAAFLGALFEVAGTLLEESKDIVPSEFAKRWEHPTTF